MSPKSFLLVLLLGLKSLSCYAQQDPQNAVVEVGEPVPPFFLPTLQKTWQSSEDAFKGAKLNILLFCDLPGKPESYQQFNKPLGDSVKVYIVDVNHYLSLEQRRKLYHNVRIDHTVLFDSKRYAATAYEVTDIPTWFLVDRKGILIEHKHPGDFESLLKVVNRFKNK